MLIFRLFGLFGERGDEVKLVLVMLRLVGETFVIVGFSVALGTDKMEYKSVLKRKKCSLEGCNDDYFRRVISTM